MGGYEWTNGVDPTTLFLWIGAVSTDWNIPGNWNNALAPTLSDDVLISDVTNNPIVNEATAIPLQ